MPSTGLGARNMSVMQTQSLPQEAYLLAGKLGKTQRNIC